MLPAAAHAVPASRSTSVCAGLGRPSPHCSALVLIGVGGAGWVCSAPVGWVPGFASTRLGPRVPREVSIESGGARLNHGSFSASYSAFVGGRDSPQKDTERSYVD